MSEKKIKKEKKIKIFLSKLDKNTEIVIKKDNRKNDNTLNKNGENDN